MPTTRGFRTVLPMRLALILLTLFSMAAFAGIGWSRYENTHWNYSGGVPSGFSGYGDDGSETGQIFGREPTQQVLSYWGAPLLAEDFTAEVRAGIADLEQQGWNISFEAVTPDWASITAIMGHRRVQMRMILLCDRASIGIMTIEYSADQAADIKPMAEELEAGFTATGC